MFKLPSVRIFFCLLALPLLITGKVKLRVDEDQFALNDLQSLNKILLYKNNLPSGGFYKNYEGEWQLNESIHVDKQMADLLVTVLKAVKVKQQINEGKKDEIRKYLKQKGLVIEYYYQDLLSKAFFVGAVPGKPGYSYAMMEKDNEPVLIYIPNAKYDLEHLLTLPSFSWQDQILFDNNFESINNLRVEYFSLQKDSFEISKKGKDIYLNGGLINSTEGLKNYLDNYKRIEASAAITKNQILLDSLSLSSPFCQITLEDENRYNSRKLSIYLSGENSKIVYGQIESNEEVFIIPFENIKSLLLSKEDLLKKIS
jgi:hypothetical protein